MAGTGRKFEFHGSYKHKSAAVRKEHATPHSFIVKRKQNGKTREIVMTRRKK